ncbi:hypothetical protein [Streptomyces alkaliterrae]|uniref:Uncharacterized protein n=1 Tax=Streptomyces alkaliterrae TaxID=2213162 RepID=A0A7W3ZNL0_9ACTN|nr:hypothetical protein [Streptomyces alkaliterrae]MBB1254833.1 hypothetical protein [Streptomyces alkaliterrae]MBB1260684.1 hypothetical protein [Streptomyces alkaliterrae]
MAAELVALAHERQDDFLVIDTSTPPSELVLPSGPGEHTARTQAVPTEAARPPLARSGGDA